MKCWKESTMVTKKKITFLKIGKFLPNQRIELMTMLRMAHQSDPSKITAHPQRSTTTNGDSPTVIIKILIIRNSIIRIRFQN